MGTFKIGELAKILGVTPDFLKHYEQYGIIEPQVSESGYRYYDFADAVLIIECLKYKRWDLSIKDMKDLMNSKDLDTYFEKMKAHADWVKKRVSLDNLMLYDHEANIKRFKNELNDWFICSGWECYFIPHALNKKLVEDKETLGVVENWMKILPISRECCYIPLDGYEDKGEYCWGFFLPQLVFDYLELEHSTKEIPILNQRFFEMNVCYEFDAKDSDRTLVELKERTMQTMKEHNLLPDGYMTFNIHFDLTDNTHHKQYGVIRVPIK